MEITDFHSDHHFIAALLDAGMNSHDADAIGGNIWGRHDAPEDGGLSLYMAIQEEIDNTQRKIAQQKANLAALVAVQQHTHRYDYETENT